MEPMLLRIKRSQLSRFGHLVMMPPGRLPLQVFRASPTGSTRILLEGLHIPSGTGNPSESPRKSWEVLLGRRTSGLCDQTPDKRMIVDGWIFPDVSAAILHWLIPFGGCGVVWPRPYTRLPDHEQDSAVNLNVSHPFF